MDIIEERGYKFGKVKDEYGKRKTQEEVANKFGMSIKDVSKVTKKANFSHTRKITPQKRRRKNFCFYTFRRMCFP